MFNHEPKDYVCPFCKLVNGEDDDINKMEIKMYGISMSMFFQDMKMMNFTKIMIKKSGLTMIKKWNM